MVRFEGAFLGMKQPCWPVGMQITTRAPREGPRSSFPAIRGVGVLLGLGFWRWVLVYRPAS